MIHDILLSCLNLYTKRLPIEEFVMSDAIVKFLHPCEKKILLDIVGIINLLRDIAKFSKTYGCNQNVILNTSVLETDELLQSGLYLKAFANGVDNVLEKYFTDITDMERQYLQNPTQSLLFIYQKLHSYESLALFLRKLIRGIRMQKLHGCSIIQYLHQNTQHGDQKIYRAMRTIQSAVNVVFLKQLTHWILYAKVVDSYGEFFIQCSELLNNKTIESEKGICTGSGKQHTLTSISDTASTYADIWHYNICYEFLPRSLSASWAEKVLFIGQTVLIFKVDTNKINRNAKIWNKAEKNIMDGESLWNEKEHIYFGKIQALQDEDLNVSHYERVIDEINSYVTTRLSEIAVNQADLVHQLRLIKDFYLLGRGELFLEFIRQTYMISKDENKENMIRDIVKSFEAAAHSVGVSEELEQFSLNIPKSFVDGADNTNDFRYLQHVQLQYKINWPLHLLFSPKVIDRYNVLFRFLLLIKKTQYALHMIWCTHTRESKLKEPQNVKVMHLRNQLMFFIDNLQYYIQVDVLESQFSILLNTIITEADFEQIQRAHSVFQANVLSLCFLLSDEEVTRISILQTTIINSNNPVYMVLNDIFHLCEDVCNVLEPKVFSDKISKDFDMLDERFGNLMEQLIQLIVCLKEAPSTTPLSQLLLRLDFNYWFSLKKNHLEDDCT